MKSITHIVTLGQEMIRANVPHVKALIHQFRAILEAHIKKPTTKTDSFLENAQSFLKKSPIGELLLAMFDNPILHDVMQFAYKRLMEVVSLFDDVVKFPGFAELEAKLSDHLAGFLKKFANDASSNLEAFLRDVFDKILGLISGSNSFSDLFEVIICDAFWAIWDGIEDVVTLFLDIIGDVVSCCMTILTSRITLPRISAFWESFTETSFTAVDVGAMILAQITYLITMTWKGKLPFECMTPWDQNLPSNGASLSLFRGMKQAAMPTSGFSAQAASSDESESFTKEPVVSNAEADQQSY